MREDASIGKGTAEGTDAPARQPPDPQPPHEVVGAGRASGASAPRPFEAVGLDALSPLLASVEFPTDKRGILGAVGDPQIPVSKDRTRPLSAILDDLPPEEFASAAEVEAAANRMWDTVAQRTGRGGRHPQGADLQDRPRSTEPAEGGMPRDRHRKTNKGDPRAS